MSSMHKSIMALATASLATVGFAATQSTVTTTDANGNQTITTTTIDTDTQVIPAPPTGVVELSKPKNTVMPVSRQAAGPMGMANTLMTTGVVSGITRPSIGDHATPPIPGPDTVIAVTRETTTTTVVTPPAPTPAPEPTTTAPVQEPAPVLAPKADRN